MPDTRPSQASSSSLPEIKISELPVASSATGTDQIEANQAGVTRSITVAQIAALSPPPDLSDYVTDEELADIIASIPPPPTTLPPSGAAGGDLRGSYPNPALKLSVGLLGVPTAPTAAQNTNTTQLATCEFVNTEIGGQLGFFLPLTGGTLTGALHGTTADFATTSAGAKVFSARGVGSSAAQNFVDFIVDDPTGGSGSITRVMGGPGGNSPLFQVDRAGDTQVSGWLRALSTSAPVAGGADYFAYTLGNGVGGNIGVFAGIGAPTFQTYGAKGALYLDMGGAVPWYNVDGAFTWAKVGTGSGGSTITVSDTPPGSPTAGALWWNSVLGTLFIYYQDPNTSQWVPAAPSAGTTPGAGVFCAIHNTTWPLTGSAAIMILNTVTCGNSSSSYNATTGRYLPPAGRYRLSVSGSPFNSGGTAGAANFQIRKNGAILNQQTGTTAAGAAAAISCEATADANGTDYFEVWGSTGASTGTVSFLTFEAFPVSTI